MYMLTTLEILFIVSLALVAMAIILNVLGDSPSCYGSCEQGRKPCDCRSKDMNER